MTDKNAGESNVGCDSLSRELLGLDPSALACLIAKEEPASGTVRSGLHVFMRRTLERALTICDSPEAVLRLHSKGTARAQGWPDTATADLSSLFAWALVREPRRIFALSRAILINANPNLIELPIKADPRLSALSTDDLLAEARARLDVDVDTMRDAASTPNPVSICSLIRQKLGIDPEVLMRPFYKSRDLAAAAFVHDPEGQAAKGLTALLLSTLHTGQVTVHRRIETVRLMHESDAADGCRPNARSANISTLLAAALVAGDDRKISFEPPRPQTDEHKALLRAAAKYAYIDGSYEAQEGLNWLADGNVQFGAYVGFPLGDRLLHDVARECDPNLERMPLLVAVQEARTLDAPKDALDMVRRAAARQRGS